MKWTSSLSTNPSLDAAVGEAVQALDTGGKPDLVIVFASSHHAADYGRLPELLARHLGPARLVGCSAGGVIGDGREVEEHAGLSVTAAVLPGVTVSLQHVEGRNLPEPSEVDEVYDGIRKPYDRSTSPSG